MRRPKPFRIFVMVILTLTPLAQAYWFGQAWQVIDAVAWSGPRYLLQALWMAAGLLVLATVRVSRTSRWPALNHSGTKGSSCGQCRGTMNAIRWLWTLAKKRPSGDGPGGGSPSA